MRTPGHAVINLAVLAHGATPAVGAAVLLGAVLPDLPIVALYLRERWRGTPEPEIWRVHYQKPFWLGLIHGMHSIPLALAGLLAARGLGAVEVSMFFASALLHALCDLPIHARDAHRHLLPFSQWRWESPLSYWDVTRHARAVSAVEWLGVIAASAMLVRDAPPAGVFALAAVCLGYAVSYARLYLAPEPAE